MEVGGWRTLVVVSYPAPLHMRNVTLLLSIYLSEL